MLNEKIIAVLENVGAIDIDEINIQDDETITIDGEEYLVLTEDEADEKFHDYQESLWDDMGIQSFSEAAQEYILSNFVDSEWFAEALKEMTEGYIEDIKHENGRLEEEMEEANCEDEDEFLDYLIENAGDPVEYYRDNFGMQYFAEVVKQHNLVDLDAVIEWIKDTDRRGGSLASYDGEEREQDGYYIYRVG